MARPSIDRLRGFMDDRLITWIREEVLPHMEYMTPMYNQIVPGSMDHLI